MPNWNEILKELGEMKISPFDIVRRKYLKLLNEYTKRNTILYATKWTQPGHIPSDLINITEEDIQGFMTVISKMKGEDLDIIFHTPGGSAEATEALVKYLRAKFNHIRVIIPYGAMSAGTMFACSADEIIMGKNSFLGPTDPQIIIQIRDQLTSNSAQAIIEQFKQAKEECIDNPRNIGVWLPIIQSYGPALLVKCQNAIDLSKMLVREWLERYMFQDQSDKKEVSAIVSDILSDHSRFKSHGRHIGIEEAKEYGLKITELEKDHIFQDLVLSVFHSTTHTFGGTTAVKIIENHLGNAFIEHFSIKQIQR